MPEVYDWATTAAGNRFVAGLDWREGMPFTLVNDNAAEMMAQLARAFGGTGSARSITSYGAVAGDTGNQTASIQAAINAASAAGGGSVLIPAGTFRFLTPLDIPSNVELVGLGRASALHFAATTRIDAIRAIGTSGARRSNIRLRNFALYGDTTYAGGVPSVVNGGGVNFVFCDDCEIDRLWVSGFSDGGIAILNGNQNAITNNRVRFTAQGISFNASTVDVYDNVAMGNRISDTGTYNGLHLEGAFGGGANTGKVFDTALVGNVVSDSFETGLNIENAPRTACVGNTVTNSGIGATTINMGLKVFGSPNCAITGNVIQGSNGFGIIVGAGSGETAVVGNVTKSNTGGSIAVTDAAVPGGTAISASPNVVIDANNFLEGTNSRGAITVEGNGTVKPPRFVTRQTEVVRWERLNGTNLQHVFVTNGSITWRMGVDISGSGNPNFQIYRESGTRVELEIDNSGRILMPNLATFTDNAAATTGGLPVGALYRTATGQVMVRF